MTNAVGLAIFLLGIVLLIFGFDATQSLSAEVARLWNSHRADQGLWLVIGGAAAVIGGLILAFRGARRRNGIEN